MINSKLVLSTKLTFFTALNKLFFKENIYLGGKLIFTIKSIFESENLEHVHTSKYVGKYINA